MQSTWSSVVVVLALAGTALTGCSASPGAGDASQPVPSRSASSSASPAPSTAPLPDVSPEPPAAPANDVLAAESFGARGDGTTDDTAALQRAIDSAAAQDAAVQLGADRTYLVSRALLLPDGAHLSGSGPSSQLRFTWRFNDDEHDGFYIGNSDQDEEGNRDITLADFAIVGAGSGLPAGLNELHHEPRVPAVRLRLVDRFRIEGLDIGYAPGISIIHQGCSNGLIAGNRIHDSGRDGINGTWHVRTMRDILIEDNVITRVGDDAIALVGTPGDLPNRDTLPHDILVLDNVIRGWESNRNGLLLGRGITIIAARRVGIVGNTVDRTHSAGILVAPSTRPFSTNPATGEPWRSADISIVDNEIRDAGQNYDGDGAPEQSGRDGLLVKQSDRVWSVGNTITNPYGRATAFYDCRSCVGGDPS